MWVDKPLFAHYQIVDLEDIVVGLLMNGIATDGKLK